MAYRYKGQSWSEGEIAEMCCDSVVESTECPECGYSWRSSLTQATISARTVARDVFTLRSWHWG